MMSKAITTISSLVLLILALSNYNKVNLDIPDHFPPIAYDTLSNPLTKKKVALGRKLFYDPILSKDGTFSCSSCHSPYNAFAHTDHDLSHGIHDSIGIRNAPPLFNLAWSTSFNWDGAINHLDMQALAPINDSKEMGETTKGVIDKLNQSVQYSALFEDAFGDATITTPMLLKSLAQFQLTLISATAKYDQVQNGKDSFSIQEQKGYDLFQKHCNSCHQEPLFTNGLFANNGLVVDTSLNDYGRGSITHLSKDSLQFKIPSLRNLKYTYPYMHDGRISKVRSVIDHYLAINTKSSYLAEAFKKPIFMSSNEKVDLVAFLLTLNDQDFVLDKKHHFPR